MINQTDYHKHQQIIFLTNTQQTVRWLIKLALIQKVLSKATMFHPHRCAARNSMSLKMKRPKRSFWLSNSNATRVHFKDLDVYNVSESSGVFARIDTLLNWAVTKSKNKNVKRIVTHLGTNDISRHNQVIVEASSAVKTIREKFPNTDIAFSSILQRWGKSPGIITMNKTAQTLNEFKYKLSVKEDKLFYLNNDDDRGAPIKSMYDLNDTMGVHVSSYQFKRGRNTGGEYSHLFRQRAIVPVHKWYSRK